jgi:hypothetical protein
MSAVEEWKVWADEADRNGYGRSVPRDLARAAIAELEKENKALRGANRRLSDAHIEVLERAEKAEAEIDACHAELTLYRSDEDPETMQQRLVKAEAAIAELEADVKRLNGMLRLAWSATDTDQHGAQVRSYSNWLADLRKRVREAKA